MSLIGLDPLTLKVLGTAAAVVAVPGTAGVFSLLVNRHSAAAQIAAAKLAAATTANAKAADVAETRAQRVTDEVKALIDGLNGLVANQGQQIERLWREVQSSQEAIRSQRHDMDAIAAEKAALADRIADLETSDRLKTGLLERMQRRLTLSLDYVQTLTKQLIGHGHEPEPPPPGLLDRPQRGGRKSDTP